MRIRLPRSPRHFFTAILVFVLVVLWIAFYPSPAPRPAVAPATSGVPQATDLTLSQHSDTTSQSGTAAAPVSHPAGCGLVLSFAPNVKTVASGGQISYALTLTNNGLTACTNASVSAYYSSNETFVSANPAATSDGYYWSIGTLAPGQSFSATVVTKENGSGDSNQINNEACGTADNGTDSCADNLIFIGSVSQPATAAAAPATGSAAGSAWGAAFDSKEFGTWVWDYPDQMTSAYVQNLIGAAAQNGFNAIYLTTDDYLDIASLPAGPDKTEKTNAYLASINTFVAAAKAKGIAVDLEGGANDWGESANNWKGFALIDLVHAYNASYPSAPVRGFQYDVESYLDPAYTANEAGILGNFVNFISSSAQMMAKENPNQRFSVVIPHFYDSDIGWTDEISFQGKTEYTLTALLQTLQQKPGSYLIVMAYRNFVTGNNGTEDLAQAEVSEANTSGYSTKVIVAQETGNVQPSYVTFYGMPKQSLYNALTQIESYFGSYSSFGGVAVHYIDPFLKLQ